MINRHVSILITYLHVCVRGQEHTSYHSSKISQVKNVVGLRWGGEKACYSFLVDSHSSLHHDFAQPKKKNKLFSC